MNRNIELNGSHKFPVLVKVSEWYLTELRKAYPKGVTTDALSELLVDAPVTYLGELGNMPGHGVFVTIKGNIISGLHLENFNILDEDET